jgi:cell division cycle 2-like protein
MENQEKGVDSPVEHIDNDNLEKNDTPEAQQTDTPKAKTKKSKWESESDIEPESEPRFSKKRRGKRLQKSVDSEVDEQSQSEINESVKRLKSSNEDSFNQSPSIQSVSPITEPINDMSISSTPSPTPESTSQSFVERIIKPTPAPPPPMLTGCRSVDNYEKLNRIEEGAYGVVFRARDKATGEVVALKKLKLDKEKNGFPITSLREVHTLLLAKHPNIVNVREIVVGDTLTHYGFYRA